MARHVRPPIGDRAPRTFGDRYPDEQTGEKRRDCYSLVGASVRGRLHQHNETPRDDAFSARYEGAWLAVAVADGAGSRPNSRYGASYLANRVCLNMLKAARAKCASLDGPSKVAQSQTGGVTAKNMLKAFPDAGARVSDRVPSKAQSGPLCPDLRDVVLAAFRKTRTDLDKFAAKRGVRLNELHSTLLGVVLNTKTGDIGIGQVGDGLILGLDEMKNATLLVEPPSTDDPSASYFITQDDWERYLCTAELTLRGSNPVLTLFLMTDGVANDCQYGPPPDILRRWSNDMDREIRLVPSLGATAERLRNYLSKYKAKGSFDDRTLVVIFSELGS